MDTKVTNQRMWCAWFDGCSLSNPGPSGIGAVLVAPHGERFEIAEPIGHATNNVAEYKAMIEIMKLALDQGCRNLLVQGDSKLVINQVFNGWKVSSPHLKELNDQAQRLVPQFESVKAEWIRREHNQAADDLSKKGAHKPAPEQAPTQTPPIISEPPAFTPTAAPAAKTSATASWKAWFDGCSLSNPGPAGIGAVLQEPDGTKHNISKGLGHATNNEAEYGALIAVAKLASEMGCKNLVLHGDSQVVINQVFNGWKVSAENLRPLHAEAKRITSGIENCTGVWIPRNDNTEADALSKRGASLNEIKEHSRASIRP